MKDRSIKKDIAIIGISGKFPKSEDILEFWKNLVDGNELIQFYSDSDLEKLGVNKDLIKNKNYIKSSAFLEGSENFDHSFFGYSKEEAELMDPQIRIMLEQVWLSLEDAGYNPFTYLNKIGCFFSASDNIQWRAHVKLMENPTVNSFLIEQISNRSTISTLISYALNLRGPSYFIDTGCSSSLVAVHIACRSLLMKECSIALAGGISVSSDETIGYMYEEGMISSKDGHCKAFDIDSSGTVGGEGVGVVVLKRLEDALNDRDHIYCVIRSSSVNNDGNRKVGFTAPSIIGQYECIKAAHQMAEVDPKSISYIETHGTGTKLGDSVEVEALNKAFNYDTSHRCGIGSLKTNIGHLDAAAGVASLIKAALSINKKTIPASLHFTTPNPEINFKSGPFYVNSELKKWVSEQPLLAGVSSLGIGGTNAHLIIEEAPIEAEGSISKVYQLIIYSAKTKSSIESYQYNLIDFFKKNNEIDLADLSYTLKTGRKNFKYRRFIVCKDNEDAQYQLDKINSNQPLLIKENGGIVFMFSGQGSQYYKMGKEIYTHYPYFRSIMDEGFNFLKEETGVDYPTIIGYNNIEDLENNLINNTRYTQPLLFLVEYAFAKLLLKLGVKPSNMIGHSLGEYVAACISEVFTFEEGLKLIIKRAHLMDEIEHGSMLSVDVAVEKVRELIGSDISIAAINTENSCVISGNKDIIDTVSTILSSKEISFIKIKTSHAFHSEMMDIILESYEKELRKIVLLEPKYPFISCTTGLPIKKEESVSVKYWVNHLRETVNFSKGLDSLLKEEYSTYIEIGSGKTLINFLRQNKNYNPNLVLTSVLKHPKETTDDSYYLLNALGVLWSTGIDINWNEYYIDEHRNKISAPTYSFDKIKILSKVNPMQKFMELSKLHRTNQIKEDYSEWVYEQGWKEIKNEILPKISFDLTICFLSDNDFSNKLKIELLREKGNVIFVKKGTSYLNLSDNSITIDPSNAEDYRKLLSEILHKFKGTIKIIHAWYIDYENSKLYNDLPIEDIGYFSLLNIARAFFKNNNVTSVYLDFLVNDLFRVYGNEKISSAKSTALAALKVIPKEYENVYCRCIEFLMDDFEKDSTFRNNLFSKLRIESSELTIALRANKTWKPFYEKIKINKDLVFENKIKTNGLYVITGANGGIGKVISDFLTNEHNANLILIGRSEINKSLVYNLKNESNLIHYIQDDLSDVNRLKNKISTLISTFDKKIDGVFHAAGLGDYSGLIVDRTKKDCEEIFLPKVKGTNNLVDAFKDYSPDFFVLCSSLSAALSPFGQVAYVAANVYQNFFAQEHNSKTKIVSIQWDSWKEVGMAVKSANRYVNKNNDILEFGITNKEGIDIFKYALSSQSPEILISINDFNSQLSHSYDYTLKNALELADTSTYSNDIGVERPNILSSYKEAKTEAEIILTQLWKSIFGYEKIGIRDDFFELGGDSLKVMTLLKRIHKSFNIEIGISVFFKKSNIEELAKEIDLGLEIKELNKSNKLSPKSNQIRL